jgi:hypothetical protein
VEGYESVLLDPDAVPQLTDAHILVELHELKHPGIADLLRTRFARFHVIEEIREKPRSAKDYPFRTFFTYLVPDRFLVNAVTEWRDAPASWFWMQPQSAGDSRSREKP